MKDCHFITWVLFVCHCGCINENRCHRAREMGRISFWVKTLTCPKAAEIFWVDYQLRQVAVRAFLAVFERRLGWFWVVCTYSLVDKWCELENGTSIGEFGGRIVPLSCVLCLRRDFGRAVGRTRLNQPFCSSLEYCTCVLWPAWRLLDWMKANGSESSLLIDFDTVGCGIFRGRDRRC